MSDVFISHVEKDADVALAIALGLEQAGFSTWCYELDSVAGVSYLLQTKQAIESSGAVVLVISAHSLGSNQITKEVVRAHESGKDFVPVLRGITHAEFQARQPEWREAIGAAASIIIPAQGVAEILPRITDGIKALGVQPKGRSDTDRLDEIQAKLAGSSARPPGSFVRRVLASAARYPLRYRMAAVALVLVLLAVALIGAMMARGRGGGSQEGTTGGSDIHLTQTAPPTTGTAAVTAAPGGMAPSGKASPAASGGVAIITPKEGVVTEIPVDTLHLEYGFYGGALVEDLELVGGLKVPFRNMKSFELTTDGDTVAVTITLLNGETVAGIPDERWGSDGALIGQTDVGQVVLSLREVERVEFRW